MTSQGAEDPRVGELLAGGWRPQRWRMVRRRVAMTKPNSIGTRALALARRGLSAFPALAANRLLLNRTTQMIRPGARLRRELVRRGDRLLPSTLPADESVTTRSSLVALRSALELVAPGIRRDVRREYPTLVWPRRWRSRDVFDDLGPDDSEVWPLPGVETPVVGEVWSISGKMERPSRETTVLRGQAERGGAAARRADLASSRNVAVPTASPAPKSRLVAAAAAEFANAVETRVGALSKEHPKLAQTAERPGVAHLIVAHTDQQMSFVQPPIPLLADSSRSPVSPVEPGRQRLAEESAIIGSSTSGSERHDQEGEVRPSLAMARPVSDASPKRTTVVAARSQERSVLAGRSQPLLRAVATAARDVVKIVARAVVRGREQRPGEAPRESAGVARGDGERAGDVGLDLANKEREPWPPAQGTMRRVPQTMRLGAEINDLPGQRAVPEAAGEAIERPRRRVAAADRGERRFPRLVDFGRRFVAALQPRSGEEPLEVEGGRPVVLRVPEVGAPASEPRLTVSAEKPSPATLGVGTEQGAGVARSAEPKLAATLDRAWSAGDTRMLTQPWGSLSKRGRIAKESWTVPPTIGAEPIAAFTSSAVARPRQDRPVQPGNLTTALMGWRPAAEVGSRWHDEDVAALAPRGQSELAPVPWVDVWPPPVAPDAPIVFDGASAAPTRLPFPDIARRRDGLTSLGMDRRSIARGDSLGRIDISLAPVDRAVTEYRETASAGEPPPSVEGGPGKTGPSPEEIEELAGSVYRLIKHRLAVERERTTGFRSEFFG
ncbi:MAG: hypothetical protein ACUVX1_03065 [Chloroflexota bacterium]